MITYTFGGLPVADYEAAYEWYRRLLGRAADVFPHDTEAVWHLTPSSAIYVVLDPERAGGGLLTIALDDLDAQENQLHDSGFGFAELTAGDAPRRLVVTDPDGNTITFFQDPSPAEV